MQGGLSSAGHSHGIPVLHSYAHRAVPCHRATVRVRRRGGYMECVNFSPGVKDQLYKLSSISLCSNLGGQICMVSRSRELCSMDCGLHRGAGRIM